MRTIETIQRELAETVELAQKASGVRLDQLEQRAGELYEELKAARRDERHQAIKNIGRTTGSVSPVGGYSTGGLAAALLGAGFDPQTQRVATVPASAALGYEIGASASVTSHLEDAVPSRYVAPDLGADGRYLYPTVRTVGVGDDTTGVHALKQTSRTLAAPEDMVRSLLETSPKPESSSAVDVVQEELKQIANVNSGIPNTLLAGGLFREWVEQDVVTAWRLALDAHIVGEIANAGIASGAGGSNDFESVLYARQAVQAAGYSPDVVALSPGDALSIELLMLTGGDAYVFAQRPPRVVVSPSINDGEGFTFDSSALGVLFIGPFSLRTFEESNGTTNSSTVRGEANGLFTVERPDAAASIFETS